MDASPPSHGPASGQHDVAAPQASFGGSNNDEKAAAERKPPKPRKPFSTVPFPPDPYFVGRPDILEWMHEKCTGPAARIALVGLGGMGKSQLALRYAHQVRQHSPSTWVFWVHASTRRRFEEAYESIADRLELPGRDDLNISILELVYDWLHVEGNGPWVMILDGADNADVLFSASLEQLARFLPWSSNGSVIVTSRSVDVIERLVGASDNIRLVPAMTTEQACQLLQEKLDRDYVAGEAPGLVHALDYVPLAITQAAAFINRWAPQMSIRGYLNKFRMIDKEKTSLNKATGDLRRDESISDSIITTWQITFEQVRSERPSAADLLSFMSFFNSQGVPKSALQTYARDYIYREDHDEDSDEGLAEFRNESDEDLDEGLDEDLEVLQTYTLVELTVDRDVFEMHTLVQFCTRLWLSLFDDTQCWKREFLKVLSRQYPSGQYENWEECRRLDAHIGVIVEEEPGDGEEALWWARLTTNAGQYRWKTGRYEEGEQLSRRALYLREEILGREHRDTLVTVSNLASVLQSQGKYKEAEQLNRRALFSKENMLGREHPDTLSSMSTLALTLWYQDRLKEAEELQVRVMETRKRVLGEAHPHTLTSMAEMAVTWKGLGLHLKANVLLADCYRRRQRVLGPDHPDTEYVRLTFGKWSGANDELLALEEENSDIFRYQGDWEDARELRPSPPRRFPKPLARRNRAAEGSSKAWFLKFQNLNLSLETNHHFGKRTEKDNLARLGPSSDERSSAEPPALSEAAGKVPHREPGKQPPVLEDGGGGSKRSEGGHGNDDDSIDDRYGCHVEGGSLLPNLEATAGPYTNVLPSTADRDHPRQRLGPAQAATAPSTIPNPNPYALRTPDSNMARVYGIISTFLSDIGLREYGIAPGYQRIRWKNKRGKLLYDDYFEHEPGALQALQDYLKSSAYRSRTGASSNNGPESATPIPSDPSSSSVQVSTSDSGDISDQARKAPGNARNSRFREDLEMGELSANTLHILSCMEQKRYAVVLHPELVTHITNDRHLFRTLRNSYHEHRGKVRSYFSLRTIHTIHFMKFASYGGRRYIDVRCHDEICEQGKPCHCLPPATLVRPNGSEYECSPVPSKFSPPIGPRLMMDFFTNPDDIGLRSTLVLRQLPKWTGGKLQPPHSEVVEAWGIYYKEGWDWAKIWWILGIGFFPPSLLFGVLWGILKQDVQGAFGVASWWMAGATIVVGIVGTSTWAT